MSGVEVGQDAAVSWDFSFRQPVAHRADCLRLPISEVGVCNQEEPLFESQPINFVINNFLLEVTIKVCKNRPIIIT